MSRHRWFPWGALACALVLTLPAAAAPVPGDQDKPLVQVPAKAAVVVQVKGFERTRERLDALIKNAMPDFADVAKEKMKEALDQALDGRKLEGVSKDGHIFLVFTELPKADQNPPKMAILVPVKDFKEFRDGLLKDDERKEIKTDPLGYENAQIKGEAIYFVNRKNGYAVVTPDADVAAFFVKKYDGIDGKLSKTLAHSLMAADVAVYVDMVAVNKEHGDAIKQVQSQLESALKPRPTRAPPRWSSASTRRSSRPSATARPCWCRPTCGRTACCCTPRSRCRRTARPTPCSRPGSRWQPPTWPSCRPGRCPTPAWPTRRS